MVRYDFMNDAVLVSDGELCAISQGGVDDHWEVYIYVRLWKVCTHSNGDYVSFCLFQGQGLGSIDYFPVALLATRLILMRDLKIKTNESAKKYWYKFLEICNATSKVLSP